MSRDGEAGRLERFRYEYGATPLHLIAVIASLSLAGYGFLRIFENPSTGGVLLWLGAAVVLHDFIALPFYSALLRVAERVTIGAAARPSHFALLTLNHIRIPAGFSLLLLLVSFPLVFSLDEPNLEITTGLGADRYLGNWLLATGILFAGSGFAYALRLRRGGAGGETRVESARREAPPDQPGLPLRLAARTVLVSGALLALFVAAIAVYGLFSAFPL